MKDLINAISHLLIEHIDRIVHLDQADWYRIKRIVAQNKLIVISKELPTYYIALENENSTEFMSSILQAINSMLLHMLAAIGTARIVRL